MNTIEFWYDFSSPYSFLSVMRIEQLSKQSGIPITWRPFLLNPLFLALGWNDSPFNIYPPKGNYMRKDLQRLCQLYHLPFMMPSKFPRDTQLATKVALVGEQQDWLIPYSKAVVEANFCLNQDIEQINIIHGLLNTLHLDADAIIEQANQESITQELSLRTKQAFDIGIFGAPSFVVNQELFWGNDRLEQAIQWAKQHQTKS